jgi:hypothetical protein
MRPHDLPPGADLDTALDTLHAHKDAWARTTIAERIALLGRLQDATAAVAGRWVETAARKKGLDPQGPLAGEEWLAGPYGVIAWCRAMAATLQALQDGRHLDRLPLRELPNGQLAARVLPATPYDHVLMSGVRAEVWMQPGVTRANLRAHTAAAYAPGVPRQPKVALVLGAGNVAAIAPLDVLHKLYAEHQVVILKMNPVNDYLAEFLGEALAPLVDAGWLRIVKGGADVGAALCRHPRVDEIHITGSGAVHDAIVWGPGEEGLRNKAAGTPVNPKPISSELGGVSPTIVVPGAWSEADILFQAEQVATQKLNNAGFNCVASQSLVLARGWAQKERFVAALQDVLRRSTPRPLYYPGAASRVAQYASGAAPVDTTATPLRRYAPGDASAETFEVFAPALGIVELDGGDGDPLGFLERAVDYANERLAGTLGANIVIAPAARRAIGAARFDELIARLRYGTIAINGWTGIGFLTPQAVWGAFPGHTLADVGSGIGQVHNALLFDRAERTVVEAPFAPFPRSWLHGEASLLPRPPWFVTHRRAHVVARLLTAFMHRPSWLRLPRIVWHAMRG